jgi:predicted esterase YcpF (UPF0227 family)
MLDVTVLLYIHGFNSSPGSDKARQTEEWLALNHPDISFVCPFLSPFPLLAMAELEAAMADQPVLGLIGSSMGGFYATWLANKYDRPAVLVNPAVAPWQGRVYLLGDQENYHSGEVHHIEQKHLDQLEQFEVATLSEPSQLMVLVQTGDEVLDYRQAVAKYADCELVVEQGGDHGFQGYENHLPDIMSFLLSAKS